MVEETRDLALYPSPLRAGLDPPNFVQQEGEVAHEQKRRRTSDAEHTIPSKCPRSEKTHQDIQSRKSNSALEEDNEVLNKRDDTGLESMLSPSVSYESPYGLHMAQKNENRSEFQCLNDYGGFATSSHDTFQSLMLDPLELTAERLVHGLVRLGESGFVETFQQQNHGATRLAHYQTLQSMKFLLNVFNPTSDYAKLSLIYRLPLKKRNALRKANLALYVSAVCCSGIELAKTLLDLDLVDIFPREEDGIWEDWQLDLFLDIRIHTCLFYHPLGAEDPQAPDLDRVLPTSSNQLHPWQIPHNDVIKRLEICHLAQEFFKRNHEENDLQESFARPNFLRNLYRTLEKQIVPLLDKYRFHLEEEVDFDDEDFLGRARLAATAALQSSNAHVDSATRDDMPLEDISMVHSRDMSTGTQDRAQENGSARRDVEQNSNKPTHELYQDARIAATVRASQHRVAIQSNPSSHRRPWNSEEERALMQGLDRVKGPYWSQILAMFGKGGTISEVLRDRNQVQLKDKARNLKLFFLKNNQEVPDYLKHVTGELRTRAPARAAKQDVKRKLEESAGVDRATSDALTALAGVDGDASGSSLEPNEVEGQENVDHLLTTGDEENTASAVEPEEEQQRQREDQDAEMARAIQEALGATRELNARTTRSGKRR